MKVMFTMAAVLLSLSSSCYGQNNDVEQLLTGPYLGQDPPTESPKIFAPGFISTDGNTDFSSCFSPDGTEFYFTRRKAGGINQVLFTRLENNRWSNLIATNLGEGYSSAEASFSPIGNYMFFNSKRPKPNDAENKISGTVWFIKKINSGWSEAKRLNENMMYATISTNNQLYYTDKARGNIGNSILMKANFDENGLNNLSEVKIANETNMARAHPFIAPDESYLIYDQMGDLYITFKESNGSWSSSKKLNNQINTLAYEFAAYVTPDGNYFFFTRDDTIYWVSSEVLYK